MDIIPQILSANVMHKRLFPKENAFNYGIYYLAFPLSRMEDLRDGWRFGVNSHGVLSFHEKDHGPRDGVSLDGWLRGILAGQGIEAAGEIVLVCMPRVLGYVFNPVSFWLCHDVQENLRAVLCEVNNTFGETHFYLCHHEGHRPIAKDDWLAAEKVFHVSPFIERAGHYKFRFSVGDKNVGVWIDHYDAKAQKLLLTALTGTLEPYSRKAMRRVFWRHPLVTAMAVARIHWQAIRLFLKGIRYVPKPAQKDPRFTKSGKMTKM